MIGSRKSIQTPNWNELADKMYCELHPESPDMNDKQNLFLPEELHKRLLKLQWDDIFADAVGENVLEFMESILTPDEIAESELRVSIIGELIKARQEKGISQKKLEELSGVKQPVIARMEKGSTSPHWIPF